MALKSAADEYFGNLNSIASRMYSDMNETKSAYEDLWGTISDKEQKQILSESIIKPEVSVKYKPSKGDTNPRDYASKIVIDDHCQYRDEHSGPFSFKTRSQRDLSLFKREERSPPEVSRPRPPVVKPKIVKKAPVYKEVTPTPAYVPDKSATNSLPKTGLDFLDNW